MAKKRLMLLGGIRYLLPVIQAAHEQGYHVITADYSPDNIAHLYSDEYVNVSIVDQQAVLKAAIEKRIDGIMSFGVDPGVVSAAYVQHQLDLPSFGPYESIQILQNKDLFRQFLQNNGFNSPQSWSFSSVNDALCNLDQFKYPVIVKPVDSAGSKGVSRVDDKSNMKPALYKAITQSINKRVIIEEFIERKGCSSDTDCFSVDGTMTFISFSAQRFDSSAVNPYTPSAYTWPSTFSPNEEGYLRNEMQRLVELLKLRTNIYNVETRIGMNGCPYIMEFTPRGGGNRLSEVLRYATGVDMITSITRAMVGDSFPSVEQRSYNGHWAEVILHSNKEGLFQSIVIDPSIPADVIETDIWVKPGERVHSFCGANDAIGTLILRFSSSDIMEKYISNQEEWLKVIVSR